MIKFHPFKQIFIHDFLEVFHSKYYSFKRKNLQPNRARLDGWVGSLGWVGLVEWVGTVELVGLVELVVLVKLV